MDMSTTNRINSILIKMVKPEFVKEACRSMSISFPEQDMKNRILFAAYFNNDCAGLVAIQLATDHNAHNAHIDWMAIDNVKHFQLIGTKLVIAVESYCYESGYTSITVETLSPEKNDTNRLKTYLLYENLGYKPLFEILATDSHYIN